MARSHYVKTSRKPHRCHAGHDIPAGEAYYWAAPGFRTSRYGKKFACTKHPFRPSQLVSGLRSEALAAAEAFEDALDSISDTSLDAIDQINEAKDEFASAIQGYVDQRQEALDAWENGNSQLEELLETAQAALDEIESFDAEDWDGDPGLVEAANDGDEGDEAQEALADYSAHVQDQLDAARGLASLEF